MQQRNGDVQKTTENDGWIYAGAINLIFNTFQHRFDLPVAAVDQRDSVTSD